MLYLTRKIGESIVINDDIRITVTEVRGKSIKLGFEFPPNVSVLREELYERIQQENREAAMAGDGAILEGIGALLGLPGDLPAPDGSSDGPGAPTTPEETTVANQGGDQDTMASPTSPARENKPTSPPNATRKPRVKRQP